MSDCPTFLSVSQGSAGPEIMLFAVFSVNFYPTFREDDEKSGPGYETLGSGSNVTEYLDVKTL